jgi:biopolymer transport protein ExbD
MKIRKFDGGDKIELQTTPMIDIVFQLLAFFCMTFRIGALEGDFRVKMPAVAPREAAPNAEQAPPIRIVLKADADGELAGIWMDKTSFPSLQDLGAYMVATVAPARSPDEAQGKAEVEIEADYDLKYKYTMDAISKLSGYVDSAGHTVGLVEKIRFSPPRKP